MTTPPLTQGYTTEQTWAQPAPTAPTPAPTMEPMPANEGSAFADTPAFGSAPVSAPVSTAPTVDDPNRPLRRKK